MTHGSCSKKCARTFYCLFLCPLSVRGPIRAVTRLIGHSSMIRSPPQGGYPKYMLVEGPAVAGYAILYYPTDT